MTVPDDVVELAAREYAYQRCLAVVPEMVAAMRHVLSLPEVVAAFAPQPQMGQAERLAQEPGGCWPNWRCLTPAPCRTARGRGGTTPSMPSPPSRSCVMPDVTPGPTDLDAIRRLIAAAEEAACEVSERAPHCTGCALRDALDACRKTGAL